MIVYASTQRLERILGHFREGFATLNWGGVFIKGKGKGGLWVWRVDDAVGRGVEDGTEWKKR